MKRLPAVREAIRRLGWHLFTAMALAGASMPGGHAGYDAVMRLRNEGPGPPRASTHQEALDGIAAIEAFLAKQAPRDGRRQSR